MVEKLLVYQKAYPLALEVHKLTLHFPKHEQYGGLADQLRRSSKSIVANLTEGYTIKTIYPAKYKTYLTQAIGSTEESILWLRFAEDLGYTEGSVQVLRDRYQEIGKMLYGLLRATKIV